MTTPAILVPGAVMPADLAYGALLGALGDDVHAVAKDLELYAAAAPPPGYTLQDEIDGIMRTANAAGFERFQLVGYSAGGAASVACAAQHRERLLGLALLEPAWIGNDELSAKERAIWHRFDGIASLPPDQMMPAFVAAQLAAGIQPPQPPPGPPPPWMASRPGGVRKILEAFRAFSLDLERLRAFDKPVLFALGGKSNPDYYAQMADRAAAIFPDFTLEVFAERHHFDPPHRIEPDRTAAALRALWERASA